MALNLFKKKEEPARKQLVAENPTSGYSFEYDATDSVSYIDETTIVYTSLDAGIPYYAVTPVKVEGMSVGSFIMQDKAETEAHFGDRLVYEPKIITEVIGKRRVAGIQYAFTDEKGEKTYSGIHGMMPYDKDGSTMRWVAFCELEDTITQEDMWHAIETIKFTEPSAEEAPDQSDADTSQEEVQDPVQEAPSTDA